MRIWCKQPIGNCIWRERRSSCNARHALNNVFPPSRALLHYLKQKKFKTKEKKEKGHLQFSPQVSFWCWLHQSVVGVKRQMGAANLYTRSHRFLSLSLCVYVRVLCVCVCFRNAHGPVRMSGRPPWVLFGSTDRAALSIVLLHRPLDAIIQHQHPTRTVHNRLLLLLLLLLLLNLISFDYVRLLVCRLLR